MFDQQVLIIILTFRKYISKVAWSNFPKIGWCSKLRMSPTTEQFELHELSKIAG